MIVTHSHLKAVHYCNRGGREFFVRHGLSWSLFMEQGIDSAVLEETNDAMAMRVVEHARQEQNSAKW